MAIRYTEEFWRDAVRIAISSRLTLARQLIRRIDDRGECKFHQI
ncbi:MAG: putative DNA-binding ribbon-helix-helix protein [Alteromonas macleodii]|jgi:predicted DNA-binding ribbon-helix-helix protein